MTSGGLTHQKVHPALFVGTLAVALLPAALFAGRPLWVMAPATIAIGALLFLTAVVRKNRGRRAYDQVWTWTERALTFAGAAWVAVVVYALSQALTGEPASAAGGAWRLAAAALGEDFPARGSLNAGATVVAATHLAVYASLALLAYWTCGGRRRAWTALWAVVVVATAAALYGILQHVFGVERVLWEAKRYYVGWATGPFENRNSFAAFLAVGLAANAGLWVRALRRAADPEPEPGRRALLGFLLRHGLPLGAPALAMSAACVLTGSRAGLAAAVAAVTLTVCLNGLRRRRRREHRGGLAAIAVIIAAGGALAVLFGDSVASRRVGLEASIDQRVELYRDVGRMIAADPIAGVGLGAFPEAIHAYKSSDLTTDWKRAHNVYLEAIAELGWPMAFLTFAAVAAIGFGAARGAWTRERLAPMPAAAAGGFLAVAGHSFVDYPLQEPAICMTLALLLGTALAQADAETGR